MAYEELIKEMTLGEKVSLMSGENFWNTKSIERLGIPSIMLTDGPHGIRKQGGKADHLGLNKSLPATCFPTAATLANSWDRQLVFEVGEHLGKEAAIQDVNVLLGPGLNIKRNPLCGRNFEYFSEDPYLTGELASEIVKGIQSKGVAACPKHYAVNSQEHMRMSIDEVVDKRSLHEIYLEGFRKVVKQSAPQTIMTSYNRVNGIYANENPYLMTDVLRKMWGFDGVVVTDWGGNNDRVAALKEGNQLEMPATNGITDAEIRKAVESGALSEEVLDKAVEEMLTLIYTTEESKKNKQTVHYDLHHEMAIKAAVESIVLLKNNEQALPLNKTEKIAIIGDFADNPRYQGAGSSLINPTQISSPLESLKKSGLTLVGYAKGFERAGKRKGKLIKQALKLAKEADKVVLFLGLDEIAEAEGVDRSSLSLHDDQLELVDELSKITPNIVVVLAGGGPIELPFENKVKAIMHTYLAGQGSGEAISRLLSGEENPSGKLNETFPLVYSDVSSVNYFPGKELTSEHREGLFIGYRYYDTVGKEVRYPFGHGLSYTTFEYSDLTIAGDVATVKLTNTGNQAGSEIVQLYIEKEDSKIVRAKRELKEFAKVKLEPGEMKELSFTIEDEFFHVFDDETETWCIEPGKYDIQIGASIADIRLRASLEKEGILTEGHTLITKKENLPHYSKGQVESISDSEFESLLGHPIPTSTWDRKAALTMDDTIAQSKYKNWVGKSLYGLLIGSSNFLKLIGKPLVANNVYFVLNMPFRKINTFTGGKFSDKKTKTLLKWINR
ncbi:glycoside hydrolase family 3 C-terminal domain-containing protein [Vagococcus fessus]|uniref:Glycosyl hydrolase n=1 Tax=Vagococcus fessus TaxID=120370 RepID=A0A430A7G1_9ENTE|nr:glycoside hydrolase family 3 C-terminal domain-containing protein [Vagococcus fessus]RSU03021.1 glycosyl hydrolase [Vagococcus fessus]